jgi:enediyne biosynthesis protein E4
LVVGGSNRWFLGDGSGFVEASGSPLPWARHGDEDDPAHVVLTDANADGRLDILVGQHFNSTIDQQRPEPFRLFVNLGPGDDGQPRFEDVTAAAGIPALATKSPQLVLFDLDGDGLDEIITTASYPGPNDERLPVVVANRGPLEEQPRFVGPESTAGPHYWIDAVSLDANGDRRLDLFVVEWEPALSSRLFLNLAATG